MNMHPSAMIKKNLKFSPVAQDLKAQQRKAIFKWRIAGGFMVARCCVLAGICDNIPVLLLHST